MADCVLVFFYIPPIIIIRRTHRKCDRVRLVVGVSKDCSYHAHHCFYVVHVGTSVVTNTTSANAICKSRAKEGYLLEPYDRTMHVAARKYAERKGNRKTLFPVNALYVHTESLKNILSNQTPDSIPPNIEIDKEQSEKNYLYATLDDSKQSWIFKTADHHHLHRTVCTFKNKELPCTRKYTPAKLILRDETNKFKASSSLKIDYPEYVPAKNVKVINGSFYFDNHTWNVMFDYLKMHGNIDWLAFHNNSKLKQFICEFMLYSNKSYVLTEKDFKEVGINIKTFQKMTNFLKFIKTQYRIDVRSRDSLIIRPASGLFKGAAEKFLGWLKGDFIEKLCRFLALLFNPSKLTQEEVEDMHIPWTLFSIYKDFLFPILDAMIGIQRISNLVITICYKIQAILTPLLRMNWSAILSGKLQSIFEGLDLQFIGDLILKNDKSLFHFSENMLDSVKNVPTSQVSKYKSSMSKLSSSVNKKQTSVSNLIGNFKNGNMLNWRKFYNGGQSSFSKIANLDFNKMGQIYSSLKGKVDDISPSLLTKFGMKVDGDHFSLVKKALGGFENSINTFGFNLSGIVAKHYGGFDNKFINSVKMLKTSGINVKASSLQKLSGMVGREEDEENESDVEVPYGKLVKNHKRRSLSKQQSNPLADPTILENPFAVSESILGNLSIPRTDWNAMVQRVGDNENPYKFENPYKIIFRKYFADSCLVIYNAVTTWYEAQNMCANNSGSMIAFTDDFPLEAMNNKMFFQLSEFVSFWVSSSKGIWVWGKRG
ncbi:hypothetical protein HELRODRAFT_177329 [Helobdella robusta]|uniref:C-type lectin domain-containing protein n=1 Tax=Helobdella robusta TaxID=6412 RepID=T1FBI2_HELRO|nr:hypothetical protein HELRODRAFT_177329 [Helobdella robusta]ESN98092.1 hypothetical protein HELRODRAFT_177329 [Helobdella robusta]